MNFCAIGIETTGRSPGRIRTIGVARFCHRYLEGTWSCTVSAECDTGAAAWRGPGTTVPPTMPRLAEALIELGRYTGPGVMVHHAAQVRAAMQIGTQLHGIALPPWTWLDSESLAMLAWPFFRGRCSHLLSIARRLRIDCARHDAVEYAVATGSILMHAAATLGADMDQLAALTPPTT